METLTAPVKPFAAISVTVTGCAAPPAIKLALV
jgi:hypothetical protein